MSDTDFNEKLEREAKLFDRVAQGREAAVRLTEAREAGADTERREELMHHVRQGNEAAAVLLEKYKRLMMKSVHRTRQRLGPSAPLDELESVGYMALERAIRNYDPSHGVAFYRFAKEPIFWDIWHEAIRFKQHVYLPKAARRRIGQLLKMRDELAAELEREPTYEELAREAQFDPAQVQAILEAQEKIDLEGGAGFSPDRQDATLRDWEKELSRRHARITFDGFFSALSKGVKPGSAEARVVTWRNKQFITFVQGGEAVERPPARERRALLRASVTLGDTPVRSALKISRRRITGEASTHDSAVRLRHSWLRWLASSPCE